MKTYLKALRKCCAPAKLNDNWMRPAIWLHKINHKIGTAYIQWFIDCYNWHEETNKEMLSQSRIFIAYDGALECAGRDTDEFVNDVARGMAESLEFFLGRVAPRVEMSIAFDDPERFPYQYVKWTTLLNIFQVKTYLSKHKVWMGVAAVSIIINVLVLVLTNSS